MDNETPLRDVGRSRDQHREPPPVPSEVRVLLHRDPLFVADPAAAPQTRIIDGGPDAVASAVQTAYENAAMIVEKITDEIVDEMWRTVKQGRANAEHIRQHGKAQAETMKRGATLLGDLFKVTEAHREQLTAAKVVAA